MEDRLKDGCFSMKNFTTMGGLIDAIAKLQYKGNNDDEHSINKAP